MVMRYVGELTRSLPYLGLVHGLPCLSAAADHLRLAAAEPPERASRLGAPWSVGPVSFVRRDMLQKCDGVGFWCGTCRVSMVKGRKGTWEGLMGLLARLHVFSRGIETYGDAVEQARVQTFSGNPLRCPGWHTGCIYPQARGFLPKGERHDEYTLVLVLGHPAGSRQCRPALCSFYL